MSKTTILFFFSILVFSACKIQAVNSQSINIKDFGAKGDGISNDQLAFEKASAYINKRKGNLTLVIPAGVFMVGKQITDPTGTSYLLGRPVLDLKGCNNVIIQGTKDTKIKFVPNLKFGSFDPKTGKVLNPKMPFTDRRVTAQLGSGVQISNCQNIQINSLNLDGNSGQLQVGGQWGDNGIQLAHYGINIYNSKNISVKNCNVHHFALDGISVSTPGTTPDNIALLDSKFDYNGRQGLSWVGGNGLTATNCSFSFTGRGKITTTPGCGIDFEAENGHVVKNGTFINCDMIDNAGFGAAADSGPSSDISFENCTFWGITNWSVWIRKPRYTFTNCNIYGSFVHGYTTTSKADATKFYSCKFEDKPYNGQQPYGTYLAEIDGKKMMIFDKCTFTSNTKKSLYFSGSGQSANEKAIISNCTFNIKNKNLVVGDFYGIIRKTTMKNLKFNYYFPKSKNYYLGQDNNISESVEVQYLNQ